MKKNFCSTEIPLYKTNNLTVEQIIKGKEFLSYQDWSNVTAESLTSKLEEVVMLVCEPRNSEPKNKKGKKFSSSNRIPWTVRLNLRRKQEASKALRTVKNSERCRKLKDKITEAEKQQHQRLTSYIYTYNIGSNSSNDRPSSKYIYPTPHSGREQSVDT